MPGSHSNRDNRGGSTVFMPVEPATIHVQIAVAEVLPSLALESRHWTRAHICPNCSGFKSRKAIRCKECFQKSRRAKTRAWFNRKKGIKENRTDQLPVGPREHWSQHGAAWRHAGLGGEIRPQPERERLIMGPDRIWRTEAEAQGEDRWATARAAVDALLDEGVNDD